MVKVLKCKSITDQKISSDYDIIILHSNNINYLVKVSETGSIYRFDIHYTNIFNNYIQLGDIVLKNNDYKIIFVNKKNVKYPTDYIKIASLSDTNLWTPINDDFGMIASLSKPMIKMIGIIDDKFKKYIDKNKYNFLTNSEPLLYPNNLILESNFPWWKSQNINIISNNRPKNYTLLAFLFILILVIYKYGNYSL